MDDLSIDCIIDGIDRRLGFHEPNDARKWALAYLRCNPNVSSVTLWRPWSAGPNGREILSIYEQVPSCAELSVPAWMDDE